MSSSHFFEGASNAHFSGNTTFTHANTVSINNYGNRSTSTESKLGSFSCWMDDDQWLTLGQRLRWIEMCDINLRQEVSLDRLHVLDKLKSTNPFRGRQGSAVKIQRRVQGAEIVQFDRQFTVISLEPENKEDLKKIWTVRPKARLKLIETLEIDTLSQVLEQYYGVALSRR
ncbi:hypothetical protein E1B28_010582 [Marasmius oreades]|uniref:Uncharacterized protein n=1 Tax=Marasmius oreades TaxID=181124 RepID=A0A9P7RY15_9AGAR|nr:uncharacterized protein E1B28_010582 [Marasmius oreades]KAG7091553.1 hypothetical protein E1B28_010582 [Marasmius oreades]